MTMSADSMAHCNIA